MEMKKYKLGELMDVTRGQSLSGEYYSKSGNLVRLTLGNFDYHNNCFKDDKSKDNLYFTGSVKKEFILEKDDIITPLTEQAIGLLGSTAKIPCSGKYIQSQDVALIKCNKKLNPDFAFYLIPSKIVRNQLSAAAQQTKIRHTSPDKIKDCSVWVPEYSEQEKIGKLLSRIDNKIAINRQINRNLEELAKQIYDYWFVQFDFPNEEGKPYKSSGGKMIWNETLKREIPESWESGKIGDLFESQAGFAFKSSEWSHFGYPVLTIKNIQNDGSVSFNDTTFIKNYNDKLEKYTVNNGNMIFAMSGNTIGKIGIIATNEKNVLINQRVLILRTTTSTIAFPYFIVSNQNVQNLVFQLGANSVQPNISEDKFKNIGICIPNRKILQLFNVKLTSVFEKIISNRISIQELTTLRDSLLPLLMNGQVTLNSCLSHD